MADLSVPGPADLDADPDRPRGPAPGWSGDLTRRLVALAGGRAGAQVLGLLWFVVAARLLSDADYGTVATGMAFFAIFAGLGDLGTTRTIVRHVAAEPRSLWSCYCAGLRTRTLGGIGVALVVTAAIVVAPVSVDAWVVLLAGAIATTSGLSELAFAALRSVGTTRSETVALVAERAVFLVLGVAVVAAGGGPLVVLGLYVLTNAGTAALVARAVHRRRPPDPLPGGPMLDAEGRYTATSFALLTVTPRIGPLLVVLFANATAVGAYSVAQRPIEAMALFAVSSATPVLPLIRSHLVRGEEAAAEGIAIGLIAATTTALVPILTWFVVAPTLVLDLTFGADRYEQGGTVLRILAVTAVTWCFRSIGEFLLLGREQARRALVVTAVGGLVTTVVGVPLVVVHGVVGGAGAVLLGELVMVALLVRAEPTLVGRVGRRAAVAPLVLAAASALVLLPVRHATVPSLAVLALVEAVALVLAVRTLRGLGGR